MRSDLIRAFRTWLRTPRLMFAIVACMAVSIGGASTVLTFVYSLLLRPLPFPEASRLVLVEPRGFVPSQAVRPYFSYPNFADLRAAATSFETLDGATVSRLVVVTPNGAERLRGEVVTPGYFRLFGLTPQLGRVFSSEEYEGRGERAILISSRLWRSHFASREDLVGEPLTTRAGPVVVVGVMPEGFLGVAEDEGTDYWLAEGQNNAAALLTDRAQPTTLVFGRLRAGVSAAAGEAEVASVLSRLREAHKDSSPDLGATLEPFGERFRAGLRPGLVTMLVASLFLLVIGCGNVAILLLARLVTRERELAVRLSMGATPRHLVRLMWAEGSILALLGGGAGLALSVWLAEIFRTVGGIALPTHLPVVMSAGPLALCGLVVLLTGAAFTLLPAAVATRINSANALRSGGRSVASGALQGPFGQTLVVGQTTLAVVLLAGGALFVKSYDRLRFMDMGFRTENLLRYQVSLQRETYPTSESIEGFYRQLSLDLREIPGVRRAAYLGPTLPPFDANEIVVRPKGEDFGTPDGALKIDQHFATSDAFEILRVPLKEGRLFGPEDRRGGPAVGLVSETLARRLAPQGSAVGRVLLFGQSEIRVVGVVRDARWNGQRNRHPTALNLFLSLDQYPQLSVGVLFDGSVEARSLIDPVRKAVMRRDPTAALHWIDTMEEALDFQTVSERFWTFLAAAYASTAVLLAVLGLYGVLTHSVVSRTREIGVRLALGATQAAVARLVTAQGVRLVAIGLAVGLSLVLLLGRLIESRLYETSARDPLALGAVALFLLSASALIALLPARRAARVSPQAALSSE
jgi:putative ABC transport system permease protein